MKKAIVFITLMCLSFATQAAKITDTATVENLLSDPIQMIDGKGFWLNVFSREVSPGQHTITLAHSGTVQCNLVGGHIYSIDGHACKDKGRRMDFAGADKFWSQFDAEQELMAHEKAERDRHELEQIEASEYRRNKEALANPISKSELETVISSLQKRMQSGLNKDDPDKLLSQAQQKMDLYLKNEKNQKDLESKLQAQEANQRAKDLAAMQAKALQKIAAFRASLSEGDETNCGPVIEVKRKLIKVSSPVANYGNEHWIHRDEIYPDGYTCHFINGQYQRPQ